MADQEVIKHTKKVFTVWTAPGKGFWHKLKEFILEIFIIVFAVSLSIYLHDRSVKKHQAHETKEFLLGLKKDLLLDVQEMKEDKESFLLSKAAAAYVLKLKRNEVANQDSLNKHYIWLVNNTSLIPNNGRFEGFKSSGKIGTIGNKELQNNIMDLYQEDIPGLLMGTNAYAERKLKLSDFIQRNRKRVTDSTTNLKAILSQDESFNIAGNMVMVEEILRRYDNCIEKITAIIRDIDKDYN